MKNTISELKKAYKDLNINSELSVSEIEERAYSSSIVDNDRLQREKHRRKSYTGCFTKYWKLWRMGL